MPNPSSRPPMTIEERLDAVVDLIHRGVRLLNVRLIRVRRRQVLIIYAVPQHGGTRSYIRDGRGWRPGPTP